MHSLCRKRHAFISVGPVVPFTAVLVLMGAACGSPPPVETPAKAPVSPIAVDKERPIDISQVADPPGLVVVGRIRKPDAIVSAVGSWTRLPLPSGPDLIRSIADDSVADVVDLSQPVDAAVSIGLSRHGVDPLMAFAVSVKNFEQAKVRLGQKHRLVQTGNGGFRIEGIGKPDIDRSNLPPERRPAPEQEDDDDGGDGCVLAHAPQGGRIVCGEPAALEALVPYLSRTMPRQTWDSDVHIEVRPEPVRAPLQELRAQLPILARSMMGSQSPAVRELIDASIGEVMDIVNDAQKLQIDAQITESGVVATTRFDFQSNKSMLARVMTMSDRADAVPAAFWHLPGDTDTAFFGRGSDPKLWDHPRELVTNLLVEATDSAQMPEAERKAIKDLVADRMLTLFTNGGFVYGKGFDQAAVEKIVSARRTLKFEDMAGQEETKRQLVEQVIGWHLFQVNEPIAKVGPILKDWSALWNRPAFAKWANATMLHGSGSGASLLPRMRVAPIPAGVTLPKDAVHLEITIPREDIEIMAATATPPPPPPPPPFDPRQSQGRKPPPPPPPSPPPTPKSFPAKKIARKPIVFHVFAVPDGGSTWLGLGLDAKLVAQKAAASLASAPDANSLGKIGKGNEALREGKMNAGGILTLRGLAVVAALDGSQSDRAPFMMLGSLPGKGVVPVVLTGKAEASSANARGGSTVGSLRVSRAVIEDIVKLVMASR